MRLPDNWNPRPISIEDNFGLRELNRLNNLQCHHDDDDWDDLSDEYADYNKHE